MSEQAWDKIWQATREYHDLSERLFQTIQQLRGAIVEDDTSCYLAYLEDNCEIEFCSCVERNDWRNTTR